MKASTAVADTLDPTPTIGLEVWSTFHQEWCSGFELAGMMAERGALQILVRRRSDGALLPASLPSDRVRITNG